MPLSREVGLGQGDIVLDGDPASPQKGIQSSFSQKGTQLPQFSAYVYCGETAGWTKMSLGMEVGLGPGDFVLDGAPAPPKKGTSLIQFSAHVYCGQTAGWIKMPLGMEVNLGPGDVVLGEVPAPHSPQFSAHVYCSKRLDG